MHGLVEIPMLAPQHFETNAQYIFAVEFGRGVHVWLC
jgi:hypothetical protein